VDALELELKQRVHNLFTLHGRVPKKQRISRMHELESLPPDTPRVLLATGKLVGEGFDHPPLDTLVLAMPISWKGILQQYAGRLHRSHAGQATRFSSGNSDSSLASTESGISALTLKKLDLF
jgi:superfamily II DNA or RNA helicase